MSMLPIVAIFVLTAGFGVAVVYLLFPAGKGQRATEASPRRDASRKCDPAPSLSSLLQRTGLWQRLQWDLMRAGVMLWPSEVAAICAGSAALGWVVGRIVLKQTLMGLLLAGAGLAMPWMVIQARKARRLKELTQQLPSALGMLASSLRTGYSLLRAFQVLAEEMEPPLATEMQRVLDETAVGYSLEQALTNLVRRTQSADIKLVVTAVQIQNQVGGNLAEILDRTAALIRERFQLAHEIAAITAEGRLSTLVLVGMPVGLALIINVISPGYLAPLWTDPLGRLMLGAAAVMLTTGMLLIRRMLYVQI